MFVYILESILDRSYYIGITKNLEERFLKHNRGEVLSTKRKKPWILVHKEWQVNRSEAFKREKYLKALEYKDSMENPSLIEPGRVYKYEINLRPTAIVLKKGHRIRVEISSSDFPLLSRNLNTGKNPYTSTEMVKANQTIYHDSRHPSHIILPIIKRK